MKTYVTKAGDVWDAIAYRQLGSCRHMSALIDANREHVTTFIFKAGIDLKLPEIETKRAVKLPPWRR